MTTMERAPCHAAMMVLVLLGSCSLAPAPIDGQLRAARDADCRAAVAAYRRTPTDVTLALQAARSLFAAADLTVQRALLTRAAALDGPSIALLLETEAEFPESIRERILSLANTGAEAAQSAIDSLTSGHAGTTGAAVKMVDAQVLLALHLTFAAWARGPVASIMAGYASRMQAAMDAAIDLDPEFDGAAPLRLKGRFLSQAPWPVGDRPAAARLLTRAVQIAPTPINHLFLGDALQATGKTDEAIRQWRRVLTGKANRSTAANAPIHRQMATLRLRACGAAERQN